MLPTNIDYVAERLWCRPVTAENAGSNPVIVAPQVELVLCAPREDGKEKDRIGGKYNRRFAKFEETIGNIVQRIDREHLSINVV